VWLPTRIVSYAAPQGHPGPHLHVESYGAGEPVTVFAAGLGGTIAETRVLGSGVAGTRVFFDFRGHGRSGSPADGDWSYAALTRDLSAVADGAGATRAVGMSMGAAALLGILAGNPDRFARNVFFLPAILDEPRGDVGDLPLYVPGRAVSLAPDAVAGLTQALVSTRPLADRAVLGAVRAPCLVIGQEGDPVHPARVARDLAAALPDATLHVFPEPGGLVAHRAALRALVSRFLDN
jgi:3-oxoadipate enol-lactonase